MKKSAGILLYKYLPEKLHVFLVHPGGPFWKNKDSGSWSIPKGEFSEDEDPLAAAKREFYEETGIVATGDFLRLDPVKLKSGKVIYAWAVQQDLDEKSIISNEFEIEWPPKSGRTVRFPEVDKGEWFSVDQALEKANPAQAKLIQQLAEILNCT